MNEPPARNPLRKHAKLDLVQTVQAVDLFGQGVGVNTAANAIGTTRKTMRGLYIDFRDRLSDPVFARWHRANAALVHVTGAEEVALIKGAVLDLLAECHAQNTCYRNYRAGRRADPICRGCPLYGQFGSRERDQEAAAAINSLRSFYHALNIYAEPERDPVSLLRARLTHMVTIATVLQNSRRLERGRCDPKEKTFLSFGTFRAILVEHLLDHPN
ncbi:hypothetical protein A7A08_02356 [Methyloligella halotolerans]|uniref:Uncharacterized protein n=1 Tax=Methyloligella halotolerans TaxID=1177755 RepID=A0A1E2RX14_9HYPH|nr:hypothetical protein [Methyloligella halotolerans]ODA66589.1 hypothetical protein A7A08_02356 [Methyloligella halotolerans]